MSFEYFDNLLAEREIEIGTPEVKKPFVLVIDDDPRIREALEFNLERTFQLRFCANGNEGLQALDEEVETVLLDVKMPGKDGLQVCKEIKERFPLLPVIFFSAYQNIMEAETLQREYNPYAYFDKGKQQFEGVIVAIKEAVVHHRQAAAPDAPQKGRQAGQTPATKKASVLVVDDDPNIRAALQNSLARKYTVRVCASGDEGVEAADETAETVVLDIKLPDKIDKSGRAKENFYRIKLTVR